MVSASYFWAASYYWGSVRLYQRIQIKNVRNLIALRRRNFLLVVINASEVT